MVLEKRYWIAILCKIAVIAITFLTTILINRGLGVHYKGEYTYVIRMVEILYIFFSVGLGQVYATYKYEGKHEFKSYIMALSIIQALIVIVLGILYISFFRIEYGLPILLLTSLAIIKVVVSMIAVIENSVKRNYIETIINIINLLLLTLLYFFKMIDLKNVLICYGACEVVRVSLFAYCFNIKPNFNCIDRYILKDIYKNGFITMIVMLLTTINYTIDTVMLRQLASPYFLGLYSVAVTFSNMFLIIPDALKEVIFGDSTKKDFKKRLVYSSLKVSMFVAVVILVLFVFIGDKAIVFLYGKEYFDTYLLTIICFVGSLSLIFFKILHPIYIAQGIQKRAAYFLSLSVIINIILNMYLIPNYQAVGASIASALSHLICGGLFIADFILNLKYR